PTHLLPWRWPRLESSCSAGGLSWLVTAARISGEFCDIQRTLWRTIEAPHRSLCSVAHRPPVLTPPVPGSEIQEPTKHPSERSPSFACKSSSTVKIFLSLTFDRPNGGEKCLSASTFGCGSAELFLFHSLNQLLVRGLGQNPIELRAVVIDQTDIFDGHIGNLPVAIHLMEAIIDTVFFAFFIYDFCADLSVVLILSVIYKTDLLAVIGFKLVQVRAFQQIGKRFGELLLLCGAALLPLSAERALSHVREVEASIDDLPKLLSPFGFFGFSFEARVIDNI